MLGGWLWYASRPAPHYVSYTFVPPEVQRKGHLSIKPLTVQFKESAAPLH